MRATGTFDVDLAPLAAHHPSDETSIGRMSIDKRLQGDLTGLSRGEMLTGGDPASGSAGYVAIEKIEGSLAGREGTFVLQHSATMTPQAQQSAIRVVPGSGTGALEGLDGTFVIEVVDGQHTYRFDYTLPGGS